MKNSFSARMIKSSTSVTVNPTSDSTCPLSTATIFRSVGGGGTMWCTSPRLSLSNLTSGNTCANRTLFRGDDDHNGPVSGMKLNSRNLAHQSHSLHSDGKPQPRTNATTTVPVPGPNRAINVNISILILTIYSFGIFDFFAQMIEVLF